MVSPAAATMQQQAPAAGSAASEVDEELAAIQRLVKIEEAKKAKRELQQRNKKRSKYTPYIITQYQKEQGMKSHPIWRQLQKERKVSHPK